MRRFAMRFNGILRGREADPLPAWIDDAIETDLAPLVRFARTLNRDFDAVKKRHRDAMEQRPSRRSDQSPEDPQTRHVRPRRSRIVAGENVTVPPHKVRQSPIKGNATSG